MIVIQFVISMVDVFVSISNYISVTFEASLETSGFCYRGCRETSCSSSALESERLRHILLFFKNYMSVTDEGGKAKKGCDYRSFLQNRAGKLYVLNVNRKHVTSGFLFVAQLCQWGLALV